MLLLFGIPVYVWMKWRRHEPPAPPAGDLDRMLFRREYAQLEQSRSTTKVPVGLGVD
jgi:hypothetical protein